MIIIQPPKFIHLCSTDTGSSGSPILSLSNRKVLGHFGGGKNASTNYGTFIKFPIQKFYEAINNNKITNNTQTEYFEKINYQFSSEP